MRTKIITRPGTPPAHQYGSKLSSMMASNVARAKFAGMPPLTYLAKLEIPDDRLPVWRDALQEMRPAEYQTIAFWVYEYVPQCGAFNKTENEKGFKEDAVRLAANRDCREIEIIEAFERLRINKRRIRDEIGNVIEVKIRNNPE